MNHISRRVVSASDAAYTAEARLVQRRALDREASVIRLGQIVFFSTATGDAWMLDATDGEVACLARDGEPAPIPIHEGGAKFAIAWEARYRIEGDTFTVVQPDGRKCAYLGYPVVEVQRLLAEDPTAPSPAPFDIVALLDRLQHTGRNDPCPCGSGRKYKKCCQARGKVNANLLDCLEPGGIERRVARSAHDFLGTNVPQAHLLLDAHATLLLFARRHRWIEAGLADRTEKVQLQLKAKIGFAG